MPGLKLLIAPAVEPVTSTEAKLWAKQDDTADNDIFTLLIQAARELTESYCQRAWITQRWEWMLDAAPSNPNSDEFKLAIGWPLSLSHPTDRGVVSIPRPPLQTISSIVYYNTANTEATYASSNYQTDTYGVGQPGRVWLNDGSTWPTGLRTYNAIKFTFVAGYGDAATAVPAMAKLAMRKYIEAHYDDRGNVLHGVPLTELPDDAKSLLESLRIYSI